MTGIEETTSSSDQLLDQRTFFVPGDDLVGLAYTLPGPLVRYIIDQAVSAGGRQHWFNFGSDSGWLHGPYCLMHNGTAGMTQSEIDQFNDGTDPCVHVYITRLDNQEPAT